MRWLAIALVLASACGKKKAEESSGSASGSASGSGSTDTTKTDKAAPTGPGITVTHSVPELSGSYDKVFGKLANADEPTTIAFVRGCPSVACTDNVFEVESLAAKCPKAYLAIATIKGQDPKPGTHHSDMVFSGPAEKPSTGTLEHVRLEISAISQDGIEGEAVHKTTDSSVAGKFKAEICGRM
jgi:hypothetical protein